MKGEGEVSKKEKLNRGHTETTKVIKVVRLGWITAKNEIRNIDEIITITKINSIDNNQHYYNIIILYYYVSMNIIIN